MKTIIETLRQDALRYKQKHDAFLKEIEQCKKEFIEAQQHAEKFKILHEEALRAIALIEAAVAVASEARQS